MNSTIRTIRLLFYAGCEKGWGKFGNVASTPQWPDVRWSRASEPARGAIERAGCSGPPIDPLDREPLKRP
jgi:hypothetical protein